MFKDQWTIDIPTLVSRRDNTRAFKGRLFSRFEQKSRPLRAQLLQALKTEPGSPKYPLHWKNRRQKRKVLMLLREQDNLPYQRSHELVRQWTAKMMRSMVGGRLSIENDSKVARYVQGEWQQRFHKDTGWPHVDVIGGKISQQTVKVWRGVIDELMDEL